MLPDIQQNITQFFSENYITFLLLGSLLIVMFAYRSVHLPATKYFLLIIFDLFLTSVFSSLEHWAAFSSDRINIRIMASVVSYTLQPFVIFLEVIMVIPEKHVITPFRQFLLWLPIVLNTVIYLIAPFTGNLVFSYNDNYWFNRGILGYTVYIVTFVYLALLILWSVRFLQRHDKRKSIIIFFIAVTGLTTGILEGLNVVTGCVDATFAMGVFMYYVYLITVHESEMQARLASKDLELSNNKIRLLREQIQPHFIFNSLYMIKALIRTDTSKAIQGISDFSDYLHANIDAINSDNLVPFEEELTHIEAFVSLALADDSKNIAVHYDVQKKDFYVPPLSIEPIVENAIRHGVRRGGNVTISTFIDRGQNVITVVDDGNGFEKSATEKAQKRVGIGIANVRTRLQTLCNGTVDIKSDDNGTTVTIRLPLNS